MTDRPFPLTSEDLVSRMFEASENLDIAQRHLEETSRGEAIAKAHLRSELPAAWTAAQGRSREERQAQVEAALVDSFAAAEGATGAAKAALENVRNCRQKLSALQSVASSLKEEIAFSRTGPDLDVAMENERKHHTKGSAVSW